jgi:hypothetical protein
MMKKTKNQLPILKCLFCNKPILFPKYVIDSLKYNGQICCTKCNSLLHIKKEGKNIQEYKVIEKGFRNITPKEYSHVLDVFHKAKAEFDGGNE